MTECPSCGFKSVVVSKSGAWQCPRCMDEGRIAKEQAPEPDKTPEPQEYRTEEENMTERPPRGMADYPKCKDCEFFVVDKPPYSDTGFCHLRPPTVVYDPLRNRTTSGRPHVNGPHHACIDYYERESRQASVLDH